MNLLSSQDLSNQSQKLCKLISTGAYSDDMVPFYSRNLLIADIETRGPITKQNLAFAAQAFIKQLPEPYHTFLSPDFINRTIPYQQNFSYFNLAEGKEHLYQLLSKGSFNAYTNYFPLMASNLDLFWNPFLNYFGQSFLVVFTSGLFNVACGDISFLFIKTGKAAFYTFFTTD
jgi:hypothetical protein